MEKAFKNINGALMRRNLIELRCKRIFLESCIKNLPGTHWEWLAQSKLKAVNQVIGELE